MPALAAVALLSAVLPGCGDRDTDSPATAMLQLLPEHIDGWVRQDTSASYDRETIFDYIDGAGEVYRSYAFSEVVVVRYVQAGSPDMTVELFDMGGPDDAYGVFSYGREQEQAGIGGGYEHKGSVLCFWQDRYYVCVASEERTAESDAALELIARAISQQLAPATGRPAVVRLLPSEGLVAFSDRFFHLHQSLNYHYYLARDNILELGAETDAVLARYQPGATYLLIVGYQTESDAAGALSSFRQQYLRHAGGSQTVVTEGGRFVASGHHGRFVVVVLDAESETAANRLLQATMGKLTESGD